MGGVRFKGRACSSTEACTVAERFIELLGPAIKGWQVAGSVRRGKPVVNDVDLVILDGPGVQDALRRVCGAAKNGNPLTSALLDGVQVDYLLTTPEAWGAAMCHMTGSARWNIHQRALARRRGLLLNEKGVWRGEVRIAGASEWSVYEAIGDEWREPNERK